MRANTYEQVEFLTDVQKVDAFWWAAFPHKVGLQNSCGTLRSLRTAKTTEIDESFISKPLSLLQEVKDIEFVQKPGYNGDFVGRWRAQIGAMQPKVQQLSGTELRDARQ